MGLRRNAHDEYCDIILREKGPADWPALTIEVESSFKQEFIDALKELPVGARAWDKANGKWRVHPNYLMNVQELAKKYYQHAHMIVGEETTDLHSGAVFAQGGLF
jgi:hypothetical protein